MKSNAHWYVLLVSAVLGGCSAAEVQPGAPAAPPVPSAHSVGGKPWMLPQKKGSALLYIGDWSTNDVYVYDFPSGKQVGTLTGFSEPYGMCVDAKGDVYVANFSAGDAVEYAHGGTTVLNTYTSGGEPIGCSVDAKGDVALSSFSPGQVTVFAGGDPSKSASYSDADCEYQWPMGYDGKGNLIGVGEYSKIVVCALLAGAKSEKTLTEKHIAIDFPGGSMWDGQDFALGDTEAGGAYVPGYWPSTLSRTTLGSKKEAKFTTDCNNSNSVDFVPFLLGDRNTPVNKHQAKIALLVGSCVSKNYIYLFHYPKGGDPYKKIPFQGVAAEYGFVVSIGT